MDQQDENNKFGLAHGYESDNDMNKKLIGIVAMLGITVFVYACSFPLFLQGTEQTSIQNPTPTPGTLSSQTPVEASAESTSTPSSGSVTYNVEQTIELVNDGPGDASRLLVWIALIQSIDPYQTVDSFAAEPDVFNRLTDEHKNLYAQFELLDIPVGESRTITLEYTVRVNRISVRIDQCLGEMIDSEIDPEKFIESDSPQILAIAQTLAEGSEDKCSLARAIYDYVGDELSYSVYTPQDLGALAALEQRNGDCTEFSDLFIALSRASGIPARFVEGVTCCTDSGYVSGENKHDWSEIYLPGYGWLPVDPTWGRFPHQRERYFAAMTPDHIIVTRGRTLIMLNGYHYYAYRYWWDGDETSISSSETWSILEEK